jgi:hypothetical protein
MIAMQAYAYFSRFQDWPMQDWRFERRRWILNAGWDYLPVAALKELFPTLRKGHSNVTRVSRSTG